MGMKRIGILLSGRGSNMVALAEAVRNGSIPEATIALVISNRPEAAGLERARERGIATFVRDHQGSTREEHDRAMAAALAAVRPTAARPRSGAPTSAARTSQSLRRRQHLSSSPRTRLPCQSCQWRQNH